MTCPPGMKVSGLRAILALQRRSPRPGVDREAFAECDARHLLDMSIPALSPSTGAPILPESVHPIAVVPAGEEISVCAAAADDPRWYRSSGGRIDQFLPNDGGHAAFDLPESGSSGASGSSRGRRWRYLRPCRKSNRLRAAAGQNLRWWTTGCRTPRRSLGNGLRSTA